MGESQLQGEDNPSSLVSQIMACPEAIEGLPGVADNGLSGGHRGSAWCRR